MLIGIEDSGAVSLSPNSITALRYWLLCSSRIGHVGARGKARIVQSFSGLDNLCRRLVTYAGLNIMVPVPRTSSQQPLVGELSRSEYPLQVHPSRKSLGLHLCARLERSLPSSNQRTLLFVAERRQSLARQNEQVGVRTFTLRVTKHGCRAG